MNAAVNMAPGAAARAEAIRAGCRELLGRDPSPEACEQLLRYLDLLVRWNSAYNLTAVRDADEMVSRHLLDSLAVLPFIGDGPLLDAGTGAGLPGIPLAILRPRLQVTLLDSAGKKVRFLRQVKRELKIDNIHPVQARLEGFSPDQPFAAIISRAFSDLAAFAGAARHLLAPASKLLAMKGRYPEAELKDLPDWIGVERIEALSPPGLHEQRHLVIMSPTA